MIEILNLKKNVSIHRIHRMFHLNRFLNQCASNNLAQFPESRSFLLDIEELTFLMILVIPS